METSVITLFFLAFVIALSVIMGFRVFLQNPKSPTNISFLGICLSLTLWSFMILLTWIPAGQSHLNFWSNATFWGPSLLAPFLFYFSLVFLNNKKINYFKIFLIFSPVFLMFYLAITEQINLSTINPWTIERGWGLYIFNTYFIIYLLLFFSFFLIKLRKEKKEKKRKIKVILIGFLIAIIVGSFFNLPLPYIWDNPAYSYLGPVLAGMVLIFSMTYGVLKLELFDMKVIITELLVFGLWAILFARFVIAEGAQVQAMEFSTLFIIVIAGLFLIKSVIKEVKQREEIEKLAKKLKKTNNKLRELDKMKTEFLSLATHQIRSPLTSMRGYVSMMLEGDYGEVNESLKEPLRIVDHSSEGLIKIVNDFLDVSRMEQGRMQYNIEKHDFYQIVSNMVEEYRPSVEERGLKISFETEENDYTVEADENKMEQVIGNLIDNAVKYTQEGEINIKLYKPNEKTIRFEIIDTGVGIAPEEISKLFSKFQRAKGAEKVSITGSGLGIYLAKRITEDHGGTIKVESEGEGKGSVFTVTLPVV